MRRYLAAFVLAVCGLFAANVIAQTVQYNGTRTLDTGGTATGPVVVSAATPLPIAILPSGTLTDPITTVTSSAIENGHVLKASAGRLQDVYVVNTDTVTNYLNIANLTSVPSDGAGFSTECVPVPAGSAVSITYGPGLAESFSVGITAYLSSSVCGGITKVVKGYFHGRVL